MDRANTNRPAVTLNPRSATYYAELHKAKFITDAQLAAAQSGNRSDVDAADAKALEEGIANSLSSISNFTAGHPLTQQQSKAIRSGGRVSSEDLHNQQRVCDNLLKAKYLNKGYEFKNSKVADHNCLITSILQHVKKDYGTNHQVLAQEYRDKLNTHLQQDLTPAQKIKFLGADLLDGHHTDWLLKEMAKDPRFRNHDLIVELWVADHTGEPERFTFGEGKTRVIIFNSTDHFEAVLPPSSSATSADSATTTRKNALGKPKARGHTVDKELAFFFATHDPLKKDIDTQ